MAEQAMAKHDKASDVRELATGGKLKLLTARKQARVCFALSAEGASNYTCPDDSDPLVVFARASGTGDSVASSEVVGIARSDVTGVSLRFPDRALSLELEAGVFGYSGTEMPVAVVALRAGDEIGSVVIGNPVPARHGS